MPKLTRRNVKTDPGPINSGSGTADGITDDPITPIIDGGSGGSSDTFGAYPVIDPESGNTGSGDSGTGKRRGRKPGSTNRAKAVPQNLTETIAGSLFGLHMFAAGMMDVPELVIDKPESKQLAEAVRGVTDLYAMQINPHTIAWGNLLLVCGMVYGPRIIALRNRKKSEPAKPKLVPMKEPKPNGSATPNTGMFTTPSQMFGYESGVSDV